MKSLFLVMIAMSAMSASTVLAGFCNTNNSVMNTAKYALVGVGPTQDYTLDLASQDTVHIIGRPPYDVTGKKMTSLTQYGTTGLYTCGSVENSTSPDIRFYKSSTTEWQGVTGVLIDEAANGKDARIPKDLWFVVDGAQTVGVPGDKYAVLEQIGTKPCFTPDVDGEGNTYWYYKVCMCEKSDCT